MFLLGAVSEKEKKKEIGEKNATPPPPHPAVQRARCISADPGFGLGDQDDLCKRICARLRDKPSFPRQASAPLLLSVSEQACSVSAAARPLSWRLPRSSVNPYVAQRLRGCGETARRYVGGLGRWQVQRVRDEFLLYGVMWPMDILHIGTSRYTSKWKVDKTVMCSRTRCSMFHMVCVIRKIGEKTRIENN